MKKIIKSSAVLLLFICFQFAQESNLFSSISSFKNSLFKDGIELELGYTADYFSNISGGLKQKAAYLHNIDLIINSDLEQLVGWKGANASFYLLGNSGGIPSEYTGAGQGISNIAAYDTWKIYEFWIEQKLFDEKLSLLFGLYDLNSEFDNRETSSLFINPSHGIGAEFALTGKNGPSIFPTTSLTLRVRYSLNKNLSMQTAVLDGVPGIPEKPNGTQIRFAKNDGLLIATELIYLSSNDVSADGYFKYSLGGWHYTSDFEDLISTDQNGAPLKQKGNWGVYLSAEKFLLAEPGTHQQGLAAFARIGIADKNINQFKNYFGGGLTYTGLIPGRDADIIGIAIASATNSEKYIQLEKLENGHSIKKNETILEFTYSLNIGDAIVIQPDAQYIINPSNCPNHDNALAIGARFQLLL